MQYESEASQFLKQLKDERPYLETEQQKGRSILWDKSLNLDLQKGFKEAKVEQKPYLYSTN